jgi:hypothetical protein
MGRPSAVVAVAVSAAFLAACGHTWPKTTPSAADPQFAARHRAITTIDILPVDVEAWTHPGAKRTPDQLRLESEADLLGAAANELLSRGYLVDTTIGWDGTYVTPEGATAAALTPAELFATVESLSTYGLAVQQTNRLPPPFLPARLGAASGADATLYIGGWTFAGNDRTTGGKIVEGILIGVAIVGIIAIIAMAAKDSGGLGNLGGKVAHGAIRVASSAARVALRAGNATLHLVKDVAQATGDLLEPTVHVLDAFGRSNTHITVFSGPRPPVWSERPEAPKKGHSRTYLELTLVDNHSGLVLWHARQQFPTHAGSGPKAEKIVRSLMSSLPPAGVDPLAEFQ